MLAGWVLFATDQQKLSYKILAVAGTIFSALSGLTIYLQFGMSLKGPYPIWILIKAIVWLTIPMLAVLFKIKLKEKARRMIWPVIILMSIAVVISVYKPI